MNSCHAISFCSVESKPATEYLNNDASRVEEEHLPHNGPLQVAITSFDRGSIPLMCDRFLKSANMYIFVVSSTFRYSTIIKF